MTETETFNAESCLHAQIFVPWMVQRVPDQGEVVDNEADDDRIELCLVETCYVCGQADCLDCHI